MRVSQLPSASRRAGPEPIDVAAGGRRDVDLGRPAELDQVAFDLAVQVAAALLVGQVPLVERDDQRPAGLLDRGHDPQILLGDRLAGVDDDDADLGPLDRAVGPQAGVVLVTRRLLDPAADTRGVDEAVDLAVDLDQLVDRVDRGPGGVVDHDPLLLGHLVEQARLADVRLADDGHPSRSALDGLGIFGVRRAGRRAPRPAGRRSPGRAGPTPGTARPGRGSTSARPRTRCAGRRPCWPRAPPASGSAAAPGPRHGRCPGCRPWRRPRRSPRRRRRWPVRPARRSGRPDPARRGPSRRCRPARKRGRSSRRRS